MTSRLPNVLQPAPRCSISKYNWKVAHSGFHGGGWSQGNVVLRYQSCQGNKIVEWVVWWAGPQTWLVSLKTRSSDIIIHADFCLQEAARAAQVISRRTYSFGHTHLNLWTSVGRLWSSLSSLYLHRRICVFIISHAGQTNAVVWVWSVAWTCVTAPAVSWDQGQKERPSCDRGQQHLRVWCSHTSHHMLVI